MTSNRIEKDSLGEMQVPVGAYYGAQTARAVENFPISGLRFSRRFLQALGRIKWACARVNIEAERLDQVRGEALVQAAAEVAAGRWDAEFVVDIFQTGSGTSTNMNANEVIARRAAELLRARQITIDVHPNDHVNLAQSSNDVIPTAIHMAAASALTEDLLPALRHLGRTLQQKAVEFDDLIKLGRTHLMDATPVRLGQEFGGYAAQIAKRAERITIARDALLELPLGGTAVGTGINRSADFPAGVIAYLVAETGLAFYEAPNHFEAQSARDTCVEVSGVLKSLACSLIKIANDLRWMNSGPQGGLAEISLPAIQPGSSIMPGKVNPVICEAVLMVAAQVIGYDTTISLCGMSGNFELNAMMPVMAYDLLQAIQLLTNASRVFADKCISGITANAEHCRLSVEKSAVLVTALAPHIGYDQAAAIAKQAQSTGQTVREVAQERQLLPIEQLDEVLNLLRMTEPDQA